MVGVWIAVAGVVITAGSPYLDGPRSEMSATITQPRLAGIHTVPAEARHVEGIVAIIDSRTQPGDRVLVFPDGQAYYLASGRVNPTKIDWYDLLATTPAMGAEAASDLARDPPKLVILQHYAEADIQHSERLDFESEGAWKPVYDYVVAHYTKIESTADVDVYVLTALS